MTTNEPTFTAFITTDDACLEQPYVDVIVLRDVGDHPPEFSALTTVLACGYWSHPQIAEIIRQCRSLLWDAGWEILSGWTRNPAGMSASVRRGDVT